MTVDDQSAIGACKTLRRAPVVLQDMRPIDSSSSNLEYSYRPLNEFNQFWAGPSHWKIRKHLGKRRTQLNQQPNAANRPKNSKSKIEPIHFADTTVTEATSCTISLNSKTAEKQKRLNIYRKWDSKRMKLPTNLMFDRNRFNYFTNAASLPVNEFETLITPNTEETGYNYDNVDDNAVSV